MTNDELITKFHEAHEVVYSIVATVDGHTVAKVSNQISADHAAGSAWMIDSAIEAQARAEFTDQVDTQAAADTDQHIANERGE